MVDTALDLQTALPSPMLNTDQFAVGRAGAGYTGTARQIAALIGDALCNQSFAGQSPAAAATTYLTGSNIRIPDTERAKVNSFVKWRMTVKKTAAGIATKSFQIKFGVNGSTADTTIATIALPAGTAVADEGDIEIICAFTSVGAGTAAVVKVFLVMNHRLVTTGLINVQELVATPVTSAGFNSDVNLAYIGLAFVAGAAEAWTFDYMSAEGKNI